MHGINMEGPYISSQKKGAQNAAYIRKPDLARFSALRAIYPVSLVDIAPEVEGAIDFSAAVSSVCRVSAAHTDCTAEQALRGFDNGITHVTHFMNAMTGCKAREPGLIGAAFSRDNVTVELICDGFHVSPVNIAAVFRCFGEDRVCVVSDSMRCADCSDGEYELGGQSVYLSNGKALLADGTIAASVTNMHREFLNLLSFGIPFSAALKACTLTPARTLGVDKVTGSIADGKRADLTVLDENYEIKYVIARGKVVYER